MPNVEQRVESAWLDRLHEDWAFDPKQEIGPVATPIVQNGKVYTVGRLGHLFCLDVRKGEVLWQRNLEKATESPLHQARRPR